MLRDMSFVRSMHLVEFVDISLFNIICRWLVQRFGSVNIVYILGRVALTVAYLDCDTVTDRHLVASDNMAALYCYSVYPVLFTVYIFRLCELEAQWPKPLRDASL